MVTYARRPDGAYRLQLYGKHQPAEYLAMGLSRDAAMGDDAVIYCTDRPGGGYQIKHAHNKGKQSNQQNATSAGGELVTDFSQRIPRRLPAVRVHARGALLGGRRDGRPGLVRPAPDGVERRSGCRRRASLPPDVAARERVSRWSWPRPGRRPATVACCSACTVRSC
ncbi:uncharacterized protein LOC119111600 [Pollicipes pollicipes]|uniref:uncharacterized protein LOC119111600 n=1 Tax=Pollicipes pollicipes TaxID=41117 RepID=UPI001884FA23|nr:uncharacterized protein LOC119111600 [Pollicipes pollicipes]